MVSWINLDTDFYAVYRKNKGFNVNINILAVYVISEFK